MDEQEQERVVEGLRLLIEKNLDSIGGALTAGVGEVLAGGFYNGQVNQDLFVVERALELARVLQYFPEEEVRGYEARCETIHRLLRPSPELRIA